MTLILKSSFYRIFQLTNDRAVQHQLQINIRDKETVFETDLCRDLQYYDRIEKYDPR